MQLENTAQAQAVILLSVLEQCNGENLPEDIYWARFAFLFNQRVPGDHGVRVAAMMQRTVNEGVV